MKFLCLVYFAPGAFDDMTPQEQQQLDDATIADDQRLRESGHLLIASPLADAATGVTIDRRQRMTLSTVDGPFAESKEVVGGFLLLEARDMDEVLSLLENDPIAPYGRLEIRPLMDTHRHSETGQGRPEFKAL
ncbi:MAG: YciI family protein [Devosia sp.]|uniref:YciI family protein n=1 Tax=Devosia sp. TaxID=1871048 RepID=UPI002614EC5D|nr:YciI family protein [Devosia sp.]MDB5586937.1 YciI family protein [Devosia sp.]